MLGLNFLKRQATKTAANMKDMAVTVSDINGARLGANWILARLAELTAPPEDREPETFEMAVKRLGLTEKAIAKREKQLATLSRLYFLFSLLAPILAMYWMTVSSIITGIGVTFFCGVLWFRWSFRLWQTRNRYLGSAREFLNDDWYLEALKTSSSRIAV